MKLLISTIPLLAIAALIVPASPAFAKHETISLLKSCKNLCPKATSEAEARHCVNEMAIGPKNDKFKGSHCYVAWQKYKKWESEHVGEAKGNEINPITHNEMKSEGEKTETTTTTEKKTTEEKK